MDIYKLQKKLEILEERMKEKDPEKIQEPEQESEQEMSKEETKEVVQVQDRLSIMLPRKSISKNESALNDVYMRITNLEDALEKLNINNIKTLIKNIAELLIYEEKKEVSYQMSNLKGSQRSHSNIIEVLKEELKIMDAQFKRDINKKIEKQELTSTKLKLERKLHSLEQKMNNTERSAELSTAEKPLMMYNSKCFFCSQEINCNHLYICSIAKTIRTMRNS